MEEEKVIFPLQKEVDLLQLLPTEAEPVNEIPAVTKKTVVIKKSIQRSNLSPLMQACVTSGKYTTSRTMLCGVKTCKTCFSRSFASDQRIRWWSTKNTCKPWQVAKGSNIKLIFVCPNCKHELTLMVKQITDKINTCAFCAPVGPRNLCTSNDCKMCYERSFASHESANEWSNTNSVSPRSVFKESHSIYKFVCLKCGHKYDRMLNRMLSTGNCVYCRQNARILCDDNNCDICFKNSFAFHEKEIQWSSKNNISARMVPISKYSLFYWFNCKKCGHEIRAKLGSVVSGNGCQYCSSWGYVLLCENVNCVHCFNRSFASHPMCKLWDPANNIDPRTICRGARKKYKFICLQGHNFEISLCSVLRGKGCPHCVNKTEQKLLEILLSRGINIRKSIKFDWCKNPETGKHFPFDFVIDDMMIIIELDGIQHFKGVTQWKTIIKETRSRDWFKMKAALANGYSIIRLVQSDVWYDKNDWLEILLSEIEKYPVSEMIFISATGAYDDFENMHDDEQPDEDELNNQLVK